MKKKYLKVTGSLQDYKTWLETDEAGTPSVAYLTGDDEVVYSVDYPKSKKIIGTLMPGTTAFTFLLDGVEVEADVYSEDGDTKFSYEWTSTDDVLTLEKGFSGKTELVSIDEWTIPVDEDASLKWLFSGCINLSTPFFFPWQTEVGIREFYGCSGMTALTLPSTIVTIGEYGFGGCNGLMQLVIPEGVTGIGRSAFQNCSGLTSVTLPSTLTDMNYNNTGSSISNTFYNCVGLRNGSVTINATTPPTLKENEIMTTGAFVFATNVTPAASYPIYVPSESVAAYKSASGWANYSSRIQGLQ